jgi:enterochelin esterase-like enzyme
MTSSCRTAAAPGADRLIPPPVLTESRADNLMIYSRLLGRHMPLTVVLPPYYDAAGSHYPALYMLHGQGGSLEEWHWYGLIETAEALMLAGEIPHFIIVLPQGDAGYWFNHANAGDQWGDYVAREIVGLVDTLYRTLPQPASRAIGGLSMGADGALQLAMNYPDVFSIVGVHSPALRPFEAAYPYYGDREHFENHYPPAQVYNNPEVARGLLIQVDAGDVDPWLGNAEALHNLLLEMDVPHVWNLWQGDHDGHYWSTHVPDYLRFYGAAFRGAFSLGAS